MGSKSCVPLTPQLPTFLLSFPTCSMRRLGQLRSVGQVVHSRILCNLMSSDGENSQK